MNNSKVNSNFFLVILISLLLTIWIFYMTSYQYWYLFKEYWSMSITMIFASFIAGASSEGGGAVAFPVMTLIFEIKPFIARNFSFAIQSVGMTMASIFIFTRKIRIEHTYIIPVSLGGFVGMITGTFILAPICPPAFTKMLFVTFWLSFGLVLFKINILKNRKIVEKLPPLKNRDLIIFLFIGILGGNLSAILGSGIDILSFAYVAIVYRLSEKVATPTSVIIMTINSLLGFALHSFIIDDFGQIEFNYWLVCIPVVILGAPLGAYLINNLARTIIARLLIVIIIVQFLGAIFILKPNTKLLAFSTAIFLFGLIFFLSLNRLSNYLAKSN